MKTCGIYGIRNKNNGKIYVGQSNDISARYDRHLRDLKRNAHYNQHFQKSFNKHGGDSFELTVLEECNLAELAQAEQRWIDNYPRTQLYNQVFDIQHMQGESNPFFGKRHSEESKSKMSAYKKQHYRGEGNPNYGKKHAAKTRIKMSEGRSGKLKETDVLEIVKMLRQGSPHQEIAEKFNICRTAITRISNGTRWTNVTGGAIQPVTYIDGKRKLSESHLKNRGNKTWA